MSIQEKQILAIDDEKSVIESLKVIFDGTYKFVSAQTAKDGLKLIDELNVQAVILDLGLPDMNGIELLKKIKESKRDIEVVVLTADNSLFSGIEAMKAGAYDYLVKPFDVDQMSTVVKNAMEKAGLLQEVCYRKIKDAAFPKELVGESKVMKKVFREIEKLAAIDATVLITGESGTGKELVARAIHNRSNRKDNLFVPINCGAIPGELVESELFGYEKGSFTGASNRKPGKFEIAERGTVFLDEISSLPLGLQAKLLRVLQERMIDMVGGAKQIPIDVRIIAATNVNLEELIKQNKFREDLYYRLNVVPLKIPPLRDRREDIILLVRHFLDIYNREYHRQVKGFSPQVMDYFYQYGWKGNVRELENIIQRLLVICSDSSVNIKKLPLEIIQLGNKSVSWDGIPLEEALIKFERNYIAAMLLNTNNDRQIAAELLGVHRNTLLNRMKSLGLVAPESE
jgi:DNA-binding NtrC family response regulator